MFRMSGFPAALQLLHKHPNPHLPLLLHNKTNLMAVPYIYKLAFVHWLLHGLHGLHEELHSGSSAEKIFQATTGYCVSWQAVRLRLSNRNLGHQVMRAHGRTLIIADVRDGALHQSKCKC